MTGTINPDGTVGPVGGIPYKIDGVVAARKAKTMLIPLGPAQQRRTTAGSWSTSWPSASSKGVKVTEVADVYEAYKAFTGKDAAPVRRPSDDGQARRGDDTSKMKAKVETLVGQLPGSRSATSTASPRRSSNAPHGVTSSANDSHDQAQKLSDEGLQAGAFNKAVAAAAYANAAAKTGSQLLQVFLTQGVSAVRAEDRRRARRSREDRRASSTSSRRSTRRP